MLNLIKESDGIFGNIDPDVNTCITNNLCSNAYYQLHELKPLFNSNDKLKSNININPTFNLLHLNIQGQKSKHDSFVSFLNTAELENCFSVIGITESWLTEFEYNQFGLSSYQYIGGKGRENRKGGGVGLYINNIYSFVIRNDLNLEVDDTVAESLFVEIIIPKGVNKIIGVIYRPPSGNIGIFNNALDQFLNKINKLHKNIIICGDFNLDNLLYNNNLQTTSFLDKMFGSGFGISISYPTRITETSATLLDQIFYNNFNQEVISGNICVNISDHLPTFFVQSNDNYIKEENKCYFKRMMSEENVSRFIVALQLMNWEFIKTDENVDIIYNTFSQKLFSLYNIYFPIKKLKCRKSKTAKNPWFTTELKELCKEKNKLYFAWLSNPTDENKLKYRQCSNLEKTKIRATKRLFYQQKLEQNIRNSKETWKILNNLISSKTKTQQYPKYFRDSETDEIFTDHEVIASNFNKYFVNVGSELASKLHNTSNKQFTDYFSTSTLNSLFLSPTDENQVMNIIKMMNSGKSPGDDGLSSNVMKLIINEIADPLVYIINKSLETGIVPQKLKIAKIIPVFKKGDNTIFSNYRPISLLSIISKLLEKIVAQQLTSFFTKYKLLNLQQFGFRSHFSTELALALLIEKISKKLETKDYTIGVFLDLSKAFDTVNHDILLKKLELYGIRGIALNWFRNYLTNRQQYVIYEETKSELETITNGVPQGSVLGPILFIIYINDIDMSTPFFEYIMFADDTNAFSAHKSLDFLVTNTNTELNKLSEWLTVNKLSLNVQKTNYMLIKPRQRQVDRDVLVELSGYPLTRVDDVKFLGVMLSSSLSWSSHIKSIRGKLARNVGVLSRLQNILSESSLRLLYGTLILPYLNYCLLNWGNAPQCHLNSLIVLQKKAVRIITHSSPLSHSNPLFKKIGVLPLSMLYQHKLGMFMFKYVNKLLPDVFNNLLMTNANVHNYDTRTVCDFRVNFSRLVCSIDSVCHQGPLFWNTLPDSLKDIKSLSLFKSKLKKYLLYE